MPYRPCPDLSQPAETELDTPDMVEVAAAMERDERDVRMLERMAEIGMELLEAIAQNAKTCLEAATADRVAPAQDPTAPYVKIAQSMRRTLALKARLGEGLSTRRTGLVVKRAAYHDAFNITRFEDMEEAVTDTFCDALGEDLPDLESDEGKALLIDLKERLSDSDEFSDFLDRPVGETVAKLCAAMGLDPTLCILDGETWKVRRGPYAFDARQAKAGPSIPPSPAASLAAAATGPPG